ncbi:EFR1 family ferrodoxin [Holophaga foetida]|uniref:EFR1 family ferrodoxin n=1 Tax=Holophaga foetida TaxID=35839 RepID=UPI0002471791|nr:EFR1 family ferrodoxin [Holophaga foetida]
MTTTLYYYTGTGNSLWAARRLAELIGDARVEAMVQHPGAVRPAPGAVVLVFPVHVWGLPGAVLDFLSRLELPASAWLGALAVNAGQVSRTLVQLDHACAHRGWRLQAGWSLVMPSNYIPWGGPGSEPLLRRRFDEAGAKLQSIAPLIREARSAPVERGPLWQRILFTAIYRLSFSKVPTLDRSFWVDAKCNGCGLCSRVCPASNIIMVDGKPTWQHHCQQCLACIQWCPQEALQYGKKTPAYPRYHHPEVKVSDLPCGLREE